MRLPNSGNAIVPIEKLEGYCLNFEHDQGKHKARVFRRALGLGLEDAQLLHNILIQQAAIGDAKLIGSNSYGDHYFLDFIMEHGLNHAEIRSKWTVKPTENFPRLTSCYVKRKVR